MRLQHLPTTRRCRTFCRSRFSPTLAGQVFSASRPLVQADPSERARVSGRSVGLLALNSYPVPEFFAYRYDSIGFVLRRGALY